MQKWLLRGVVVCAVFLTVWVAMLLLWRTRNQLPSSTDVILYLLVLPIAILLLLAVGRKLLPMFAVASAAGAASASPMPAPPSIDSKHAANDASKQTAPLIIAGHALRVAQAHSAEELRAAFDDKKTRPTLDPQLSDADGFPIFSFRSTGLDVDAQQDAMAHWQAENRLTDPSWSEEELRALAMAGDVLTELSQLARTHIHLHAYLAAPPAKRASIPLPVLQLIVLLPAGWEDAKRQLASKWLMSLLEAQAWPVEKSRLVLPIGGHDNTFGVLDLMSSQMRQHGNSCFAMLLACDSGISEEQVSRWERAGELYSAKNQDGKIPGEGAAGMLLADAEQAAQVEADGLVMLHQLRRASRDKSADAAGRVGADAMKQLIDATLEASALTEKDVKLVVADADHRVSRIAEVMEMSYQAFPELDLQTQCLHAGTACGSVGAVSGVLSLALASHAAAEQSEPVLCVSNLHAFERAAIVLTPFAATEPAMQNAA